MGFGKKPTNDTLVAAASGMVHSDSLRSFQDIFTTGSSGQAKDMILSGVRHELHHSRSRATSESGSDEVVVTKVDPVDLKAKPTILRVDRGSRKATMLLAGPKFRHHTVDAEVQLKRDTVYPISVSLFLLPMFVH
jgi:glycerol-3-phosphate dehydrogenase